MAQFTHRVDLSKSNFPLLSSELGRTVLISNNRNTPTSETPNEPEVLYLHNVIPTSRGLQSIGFKQIIDAASVATVLFKKILHINSVEDHVSAGLWHNDAPALLAYTTEPTDDLYISLSETDTWIHLATLGSSSIEPTVANVKAASYILIRPNVVVSVDEVGALLPKAFIGSPFAGIYGITEAFGYLIAWGNESGVSLGNNFIAWSSLIDPLNLTPSAATGAGGGSPAGAKGEILFCAPNSRGFLVYCKNNVVAAIYTGNKSFPFKFVPIKGSKGMDSDRIPTGASFPNLAGRIAYDTDLDEHFAYTAGAGLQLISSDVAKNIFPEVTDFLAGRLLEDFDVGTKTFSTSSVAVGELMSVKLALVSTRYLVISYGIDEYTHALVYDLTLERWGKIRFTHVDVFEHRSRITDTAVRELAKESVAFMDKTGLTSVVSFNPNDTVRSGALILGKYQYHRDRQLVLQKVVAENVVSTDSFSCTDLASLDGRNISSRVAGVETAGEGYREYAFHSSAKNHSLALIGSFILNTVELLFTLGGRR